MPEPIISAVNGVALGTAETTVGTAKVATNMDIDLTPTVIQSDGIKDGIVYQDEGGRQDTPATSVANPYTGPN